MLVATAPGAVVVGGANAGRVVALPKLKVFGAVIRAIAVLVVDLLVPLKKAAKRYLHHVAMLPHFLSLGVARMVEHVDVYVAVPLFDAPKAGKNLGGHCGGGRLCPVALDEPTRVPGVNACARLRLGSNRSLTAASTLANAGRRGPTGRWAHSAMVAVLETGQAAVPVGLRHNDRLAASASALGRLIGKRSALTRVVAVDKSLWTAGASPFALYDRGTAPASARHRVSSRFTHNQSIHH